ncbi:MAG: hypothetical protein KDD88_12545, partial [Rhodobacteraceae bacterium]|nr:hypothetical protein [Paracoccaceae bacterium]
DDARVGGKGLLDEEEVLHLGVGIDPAGQFQITECRLTRRRMRPVRFSRKPFAGNLRRDVRSQPRGRPRRAYESTGCRNPGRCKGVGKRLQQGRFADGTRRHGTDPVAKPPERAALDGVNGRVQPDPARQPGFVRDVDRAAGIGEKPGDAGGQRRISRRAGEPFDQVARKCVELGLRAGRDLIPDCE